MNPTAVMSASHPLAVPRSAGDTTSGMSPAQGPPDPLFPSWTSRYTSRKSAIEPPAPKPASARRQAAFTAVPTTMYGRLRPNGDRDRSESAPASGVTTMEGAAPGGGTIPFQSSFLASPTIPAICVGSTIGSNAPQCKS